MSKKNENIRFQYKTTITIPPKIEPTIIINTKDITRFIPKIFNVVTKDGRKADFAEQSVQEDESTAAQAKTKQTKLHRKNGRYTSSKFIMPVLSYLAIRIQLYCPHINPNTTKGITAKNTVLLLYPDRSKSKYPPTRHSEEIKNTFALEKLISARAILSKSPSTDRIAVTIPTTIPMANIIDVQITIFLFFEKKICKLDKIARDRTDAIS